jgi:L-alanine-DL-glutamate epimerase-like enolase superfamily enzyme
LTAKTRRWAIQSGEHGPIAACLAGLDLALWDMAARKADLPLRAMLGGKETRASIPAYASGLNPDSALNTIAKARAAGFKAFKVKVAFGLEQDLAVLDRINEQLAEDERLMVDANQGWDMPEARIAVTRMSERNLGWIEEPIPADSAPDDWAELAMLSTAPIAGGENIAGFSSFSQLISQRNHKVVQPDVLKWGGITGCFAVARQAVANGLIYCPHWLGSGIGLAASAHLLSAAGGDGMLEHDVMENPLREPLAIPFPRVRDGKFPMPPGPGLGVEPDLAGVAQWLLDRRDFTQR